MNVHEQTIKLLEERKEATRSIDYRTYSGPIDIVDKCRLTNKKLNAVAVHYIIKGCTSQLIANKVLTSCGFHMENANEITTYWYQIDPNNKEDYIQFMSFITLAFALATT